MAFCHRQCCFVGAAAALEGMRMLVDGGTAFQFDSSCVGHGAQCPMLALTLVSLPPWLLRGHQEHGAVRAAFMSEHRSSRFVGNNELPCEIAASFKAVFSTKVPSNLIKT